MKAPSAWHRTALTVADVLVNIAESIDSVCDRASHAFAGPFYKLGYKLRARVRLGKKPRSL